jgi:hypothetical protein
MSPGLLKAIGINAITIPAIVDGKPEKESLS